MGWLRWKAVSAVKGKANMCRYDQNSLLDNNKILMKVVLTNLNVTIINLLLGDQVTIRLVSLKDLYTSTCQERMNLC